MADIRVEHVFKCSPETFWKEIFFDATFNRTMYLEELGFSVWRELEVREDDTSLIRTIEVAPPVGELPGPLKKLLGDGFGYREEGRFDKQKKRYYVRAIPNRLSDKLSVEGELWCEAVNETSCRRLFEAKVQARIFGVGGLLESRVVADMRRNYEDSARYTEKHLAKIAAG